jgi:hypothetical protein
MQLFCMYTDMNVIMLGGPLVYFTLLFGFDFYLTGSSIYVYMSDLVGRWIAKKKKASLLKRRIDFYIRWHFIRLFLCCTDFTEIFWTFSIVRYSKKHDVSETGSVSILR